ncbi:MAG: ABC transporter ATP-binding protein [Butyricicoccus sp.]|nr:ABC transporter ATP-binding protein [Butyricicoccus sp.]
MEEKQIAVEMRDMHKIYPNGTVANSGVNFSVAKGEVHALVGENGAGKSTLMKVLYGLEERTGGQVEIFGKEVHFRSPKDAIACGLGMVHQEFMLVPSFTVAENVVLGNEKTKHGFCDRNAEKKELASLSEQFGLRVELDEPVYRISVGAKQRVEILKVLYNRAKIIILDEPTAVLTPQETDELFRSLRLLVHDGYTIILITHKIREVMEISDHVTVLRGGRTIRTLKTSETTPEEISELMIGRKLNAKLQRTEQPHSDKPVFEVRGLRVRDQKNALKVKDISFSIHKGEIFGIAGVEGNGQAELIDALTGFLKPCSGEVYYHGKNVTGVSAAKFRKQRIGYIPDDRNLRGSSLSQSIAENLLIGFHERGQFRLGALLRWNRIRQFAKELIQKYDIKAASEQAPVCSMSGGNIQKVIVAREINDQPDLLIACQPTRGVDISSIEYIHNKIIEQRNQGTAVLLISAELSEIMGLSDQIGMLYDGSIVAIHANDGTLSEQQIGAYILNGQKDKTEAEA